VLGAGEGESEGSRPPSLRRLTACLGDAYASRVVRRPAQRFCRSSTASAAAAQHPRSLIRERRRRLPGAHRRRRTADDACSRHRRAVGATWQRLARFAYGAERVPRIAAVAARNLTLCGFSDERMSGKGILGRVTTAGVRCDSSEGAARCASSRPPETPGRGGAAVCSCTSAPLRGDSDHRVGNGHHALRRFDPRNRRMCCMTGVERSSQWRIRLVGRGGPRRGRVCARGQWRAGGAPSASPLKA
jgi:hypothetical protein